jgi:hypothetical protein
MNNAWKGPVYSLYASNCFNDESRYCLWAYDSRRKALLKDIVLQLKELLFRLGHYIEIRFLEFLQAKFEYKSLHCGTSCYSVGSVCESPPENYF